MDSHQDFDSEHTMAASIETAPALEQVRDSTPASPSLHNSLFDESLWVQDAFDTRPSDFTNDSLQSYLPRRSVSEPPGGGHDLDYLSDLSSLPPAQSPQQPVFQRQLLRDTRPKKSRAQPYPTKQIRQRHIQAAISPRPLISVPIGVPLATNRSQITSQPSGYHGDYHGPEPMHHALAQNSSFAAFGHPLPSTLQISVDELRGIIAETVRQTLDIITATTQAR